MTVVRKPRVMLFTDSFVYGGTERQLVQVLRHLDRGKYDLQVGCLKRKGPFLADVEALGIPIAEFPLNSLYNLRAARWFWQLVRFLRRQRIDILHAFDFYTSVFAVPAARLAGVPVILASRRETADDRTPWQRRAIRIACQLATHIVANSRAAGTRLPGLRDGESKKVTIVPNGINLDEFDPTSAEPVQKQLGLVAGAPVVGTVAALRPEKDLCTFLRAAARVSAAVPEVRFLIVGGGAERQRLEGLTAELSLSAHVLFLGDRSDVSQNLAAMDVFVLSSIAESCPNAVLEAMAMARPVVAAKVGGLPELVEEGKTGYLVPAGNDEAMSRRILALLGDQPLREAMGEAGRARVEREFTIPAMKERLEALYDEALRQRRPAARILQISNYPPPVCGWSIHTQLLQRELTRRGADCRVLDIGPGRRIPGRGCIPVRNGLDYVAKLLAYRARGFTFHVHVNGDSWKGYLLAVSAVLLGRLTGKPPFLVFHAGPKQQYFPVSGGFWFHAFRLLFHSSGQIICNFEPVKAAIQSYGVPVEKIHGIASFSVQYNEAIPARLPEAVNRFLETHEPRLFSYTLFRPEFTMECFFEALARLRRQYPRVGLLIAGPPEVPPAENERMNRLGILESVLVAGNLPHAEFLTAVQRSDVFVRTHLRDGVCSSVLEALSLGVPVVAAEDGHRPPSVITYAPGDATALQSALAKVLANLDGVRTQVRRPEIQDNLEQEVSVLLAAAGQVQR